MFLSETTQCCYNNCHILYQESKRQWDVTGNSQLIYNSAESLCLKTSYFIT